MAEILLETVAEEVVVETAKTIVAEALVKVNAVVVVDLVLYAFIFGVSAFTLFTSQAWLIYGWFRRYGNGNDVSIWWRRTVEPFLYAADILMVSSICTYAWEFLNPSAGSDANYYTGILSLYFFTHIAKLVWTTLLWRYHTYTPALWLSVIAGLVTLCGVFTEVVLFGIRDNVTRHSLVSIASLLFYGVMFGFNIYLAHRNYKANPVIETRANAMDERMLKSAPLQSVGQQARFGSPVRV